MLDLIFVKGGWVMYVIMALSIYVLGIVFFKIYQFIAGGVFNTSFIDRVMTLIKRGELTDASAMLAREVGPIARIMRISVQGVMNREITMKSREAEISRVGASEIRYLESHLRGLEMAFSIGPLLGLLGTVIGMIAAFAKLAEAGSRVDPSQLAGGIWEALITTVGGLCVAVPAMAAYYLLDSFIERVRASMRDVTVQILALEDVFVKNEREQEKREIIEREERAQRRMEEQAQALAAERAERERLAAEQAAQAKALLEEKTANNHPRNAPQSSSTLQLLNPNYTKF